MIKIGVKSPKIAGNLTGLPGKLATNVAIIPKHTMKNKKSIMSRFCIWIPSKQELNKKKESDNKNLIGPSIIWKKFFVKKSPSSEEQTDCEKNLRFVLFERFFAMFIEYKSGEHGQNRDKKTPNQEQFQSLEGLVKSPVLMLE